MTLEEREAQHCASSVLLMSVYDHVFNLRNTSLLVLDYG